MKMDLPKTRGLWKEFVAAEDRKSLAAEKRKIDNEIETKKSRLEEVESTVEYQSITGEIDELEKRLEQNKFEWSMQAVRVKEAHSQIAPKLKDTYNQEFKPYHDRYKKLDKDLKKQLENFVEVTEPIIDEMKRIENLEFSFSTMQTRLIGGNNSRDYLSLPKDRRKLEKARPWTDEIDHTLVGSVKSTINAIKRIIPTKNEKKAK